MLYCVYLMASQKNGTLYAGVTNNLEKWLGSSEQHFPKDKWTHSRVSAHGNALES